MDNVMLRHALVALCALSGCASEKSEGEGQTLPSDGAGSSTTPPGGPGSMPADPGSAGNAAGPMAGGAGAAGDDPGPMTDDPGSAGGSMDAMPPVVMEPEAAWESLIEAEWEVPPNTESYLCARRTLTEDVYVSAFKALNPSGTHHTVLTVGQPGAADGVTPCNSGVNSVGGVYGSGVGTDALEMPEGVAFPLRAGQQLVLNMHLFNVTDQPMTGTTGTLVQTVTEVDAEHTAEVALITALLFSIPPHQVSTFGGQCTMSHDVTAFAVLPHMHMLGAHAKVTVMRPEGVMALHDLPFGFEEQAVYPIEPVTLRQGEVVRTECTWNNTTDRTVRFGESSLDEMCNIALFRYPAGATPVFACSF